MKKRFASLIMALVMALSLAIPAFAASGNSETSLGQTTKISSTTKEATIKVTVPATLTAALNPYGIGYKINDTWLAAQTYNQSQVASPDYLIISQSNIPLDVYVNAVGTPASGVTLESATVGTKKTKSVFMYAVFGTVDTALVGASDIENAVKESHDKVGTPVYPIKSALSTTPDSTTQLVNQIIIKTTALSKAVKVGTLQEVPYSGEPLAPQTISAIAYKLDGDMVIAPENNGVANNWLKTDKVDIDFTFTFVPGTANVAADYEMPSATSVSLTANAAITSTDLPTLLTSTPTWTTKAASDLTTADYRISEIKIDNTAPTGLDTVITLDGTTKKVTIANTVFGGNSPVISGARVGETHYLTFKVTYVDEHAWTISKIIKQPLTIAT